MKKLGSFFIVLLFWALSLAAYSQQTMQEKVDALLKLATDAPSQQEGARAVDNYLMSLSSDERFSLEAATFLHMRKTGIMDRTTYARNMLELNEQYAPTDYITLDYWRYIRMLDAKVRNGTLPEEEYRYLADKKFDEAKAATERRHAAEQAQQIHQAQTYRPPSEPDNTGLILQSIGKAFHERANQMRPPTSCTSRSLGGTVYTDCR